MNTNPVQEHLVLLLGGTGRTGGRVLKQLLDRGVHVRAIVRSANRLPEGVAGHPRLTVIEADVLALSSEEMLEQVRGCDAVISCLGHTTDLKGIFGAPRELVAPMVERVCAAAVALEPTEPLKVVLMSSVSVHRSHALDPRRGSAERAFVALLRALVPPAKDNQDAADYLLEKVGSSSPFVQWAVVRCDTLVEGDVSKYALHESFVSSLAKPDDTSMANVAHFMCDLVTEPQVWGTWKGLLPVIANAAKA
ncbi:MAG: SDR family oxidoreductase [Actinomycetota bacterium]|nr:MAG: hypothetical protein FD171_248 [Actinomycetota bacterium]MDO8949433.1 SDR family oxidoreductase [Actinomycetota bacterium]MDP3631032.1 SDR family oxidoreductase [Actinomycetota bacterium]